VKPFFEDLDVVSFREIDDPAAALHALWEAIAGGAAELLENRASDKVATKIPIEGRVEDAGPDVTSAVGSLLVNAFFRALIPRVDESVSIAQAKEEQTEGEKREEKEQKTERSHREARAEGGGAGGKGER
jgi:hypothetical protein